MKAITREEKIMSGENLTPITRKEMSLAKASGQNVQTPTPITREEMFLSKITGGGGSDTDTDDSIVGTWKFNKEVQLEDTNGEELCFNGEFRIYKNNGLVDCNEISIYNDGDWANIVVTSNTGESYPLYDTGNDDPWDTHKSRELIVLSGDEQLLNILKANAVKQAQPSAYTVSSVDELPSDAVDGSTAIVSNNDIKGNWLLNEQVAIEDGMDLYPSFTMHNYRDNSVIKVTNIYAIDEGGYLQLYYMTEDEDEYPAYDTMSEIFTSFTFRNIRVIEADAEAEAWIRANGKKLPSFYIRENGEWVYKCEVA